MAVWLFFLRSFVVLMSVVPDYGRLLSMVDVVVVLGVVIQFCESPNMHTVYDIRRAHPEGKSKATTQKNFL